MNRIPGCTVAAVMIVWVLAALASIGISIALVVAVVHFLFTH
ncbi:hypothetical protein [Ktedonospora formicarum]|nr:hypothetical protein [Ktedonospora formicarum]